MPAATVLATQLLAKPSVAVLPFVNMSSDEEQEWFADGLTEEILNAAREEGATGATVLNQARGEGLAPTKTFLGLSIGNSVDVIMMLVEEHLSRQVLERIAEVGQFDQSPGTGITFQVDVEDAIGVRHQIQVLEETVEDRL